MIYQKQVIKELSISSVGIFFILLIILMSIQLVNLLGKVAKGVIGIDLLVTTLGVSIIGLLPLLLCITCYIAVLLVLSRYWRDSEMVIWSASGLSLTKWIKPISFFMVPFVFILLLLTLYFIPSINARSSEYYDYVKGQPSLDFIEQGVFVPVNNGVIFLDELEPNTNRLRYFFSHSVDPSSGKFEVTLAQNGHIELDDKQIRITLNQANRYLGYPNQADFSIFYIPKVVYYVESSEDKKGASDLVSQKDSLSNKVLWESNNPVLKSTLVSRLSVPISAIILVLLAIPLAYTNTRHSKNFNIIIAIIIFFMYQNGLILFRNLVAKEIIGFWTGLLFIPIIVLFATWFFYLYRMRPKTNFINFLKLFFKKESAN